MPGPWDKYQPTQPQQPVNAGAKPWEKYNASTPVASPAPEEAPQQSYPEVLQSALAEIEQLNAQQVAAGREPLSAGAQAALTDQYRQQAGFAPRLPQMDELNRVDYGAAEEASQGVISDFLTAPAQAITGIGTGIVGAFSPETARRMEENQAAYYGTGGRNTASRFYGGTIGGAANVIAAAPAGVVGMAGIYGASGAGQTRTDINRRRMLGEEISGAEEARAAALIGGAEGLSGLITGGILNRAKGLLGGVAGGTVTREAGAQGLRALVKRELPDLVTEVGEEMATQLFTNAVRKNTYADDQEYGEGVLEAGLMSVLPILQARGIARRMEPARQEQQQRRAARRGEVRPEPRGPMQDQFEAGPGLESGEITGSAMPMTKGDRPFETFVGTPAGPDVQQVAEVDTVEGAVPTVDAEPDFNDPTLRAYMDGLTGPTFDSQVGRRPVIDGETVGADVEGGLIEEQAVREGILRSPTPEPTAEQRRQQAADADAALEQQYGAELDAEDAARRFPDRVTVDELATLEAPSADLGPSPSDVDMEMSARFQKDNIDTLDHRDGPFVKRVIPIADLEVTRDATGEQEVGEYAAQDPATSPPIVAGPPVDGTTESGKPFIVPDGSRRVAAAQQRGETEIVAYVPEHAAPQQDGAQEATNRTKRAELGLRRSAHPTSFANKLTGDEAVKPLLKRAADAARREGPDAGIAALEQEIRYEAGQGNIDPNAVSDAEFRRFADAMRATYARGREVRSEADIEREAIEAGVMRLPLTEPTAEQRRAQSRAADAEMRRQAEEAELEDLAWNAEIGTTGTGSAFRPGAGEGFTVDAGDPGRQFGRGVRGNPVFPTTFDAPSAKQLNELAGLAEPGMFGRFWRKTKDLLRDPTTGVLGQIEGRKIESTGRVKLAALEARRAAKELNKVAKELDLDIDGDTDVQIMLEEALRNERVLDDPKLQEAVTKFRKAVDYSSQVLADTAKAAGLDPTVYEDNIGRYTQNVTRRAMEESRGILRTGAREFAPTKGYQQVKRDAYILWDGSKVHGKYKTAQAANDARAALVTKRKNDLIKAGAKRRGVTENDITNRAAKGLLIDEPISAEQRRETEVHDIRYLATKSVLDNTHNASMIDLHVAAGDQFGQPAPEGLSAAETAQWAQDQGLVALPGYGVFHNLRTFVPKKVGDRLQEYTDIPTGVNEMLRRFIVQPWKTAMTVYNPATWGRNYIGSQIHATLDGTSIFDPRNWPAYAQAVVELARKERSPLVRRLIERGDLDSDYDAEQARQVALRTDRSGNILDATMGAASAVHRGMTRGYSYGDNLAKVASVIAHQKRDGMHMDEAIVEMERSHPNYNRVARITKFARNNAFLGAPFVSYMDQSIRNMGRGFVREGQVNPNVSRAALIVTVPYMIDQLSRAALGMGDEEDELLQRDSAAGYFLKTLAEPIVWNPFSDNGRDGKGRVMRLNLRYVIPALHDFVPEINNGSLQMPFGFLSGPVIDSILEQITGKERFSGYEFLTEDMTAMEQAKARAGRLVQTFAPLPPEIKRGARRPRKAIQGQSEEPVANAMLATLTGIDTKTPYVAEQDVKKMINNAIDAGEAGEARAMLELWNEVYKPGSKAKLDPTRVISGYKSSLRSKRSAAIKKAGDALFLGKTREANRLIEKYNKERGEVAPELTIQEIEGAVEVEQQKGREY